MSRLQKLSLSLFVFFVVGSSTATSAFAYAHGRYALGQPTQVASVNCAGEPRTIRYTIGNITDGSILMPDGSPLPAPLIKASIEKALWFWTTAVNFHFVEVPEGPLTQLRFRHSTSTVQIQPPPADPIPKAQATCLGYRLPDAKWNTTDGDRWQESGTTPNPDILGATIHEVGHIIGLHHSNVTSANMYWIFHRYSGLDSPELVARQHPDPVLRRHSGIHSMYGAGVGSVTPIPEPATAS